MRLKLGICIIIVIVFCIFLIIKNYKRIYGKYRWLKRKYKRKIFYLRKKYFDIENRLIKSLITLLILFCYLTIVLVFFKNIGIIEFKNNKFFPIIDFERINIEKNSFDFLWAQISSSLIVSTVVSLLSIFSENYVYGKKQINVIFNKNSLLSLGKIFSYLIILIFVSFAICLKQSDYCILLLSFIISISLIFYMLFNIIIFYTHPFFFKKIVKSDYIKREKRHIKKAKPLEAHSDIEIQNLKEITMAMIQKNDNNYNININAIMDMIETSLLSNSKRIQEYYTEMIYRTDFISSILEIISHLIKYNKISEANNLMAQLYSRLKFYRIVLIHDDYSYSNIMALINAGKYILNENEAKEHYKTLWRIINCEMYFVYLYQCELDLSYCRLGMLGDDYIYYYTHNCFLENLYLSIVENKYLSKMEKNRIFDQVYDDIRMMEHKEEFPDSDIRHYWNDELNKNKINVPLIIKGEPIVLMLLKMFELKDVDNLKRYRTMNVSVILKDYIVCLTSLSIIEFLHKGCVRKYVNDLDLTKTELLEVYINSNFHNIIITSNYLKKLYLEFIENYINQPKGRAYVLLSRLTLSIEVINNYFFYMFKEIDRLEEFYKLVDNNSFSIDKSIINIIKNLKIRNKIKLKKR